MKKNMVSYLLFWVGHLLMLLAGGADTGNKLKLEKYKA